MPLENTHCVSREFQMHVSTRFDVSVRLVRVLGIRSSSINQILSAVTDGLIGPAIIRHPAERAHRLYLPYTVSFYGSSAESMGDRTE